VVSKVHHLVCPMTPSATSPATSETPLTRSAPPKPPNRFQDIFYPESKFGGFTDIDGTIAFYARINALLEPSFTVLDAGCGRGCLIVDDPIPFRQNLQTIKGKVQQVIGIDVDPVGKQNPYLDDFRMIDGNHWPVEDNSIDLCFSSHVVEHLPDPDAFFSEARRVLKNGGYLCLRTTNLWNYMGILSSLIPNKLHSKLLAKVQDGRKEEDVFPTTYRCNTIFKMQQMLDKHGFEYVVYGYEAEPSYLSFSKIAYLIGKLHQMLAPKPIRQSLFAFAQVNK
jgi:SAM-dependent methyltransferase